MERIIGAEANRRLKSLSYDEKERLFGVLSRIVEGRYRFRNALRDIANGRDFMCKKCRLSLASQEAEGGPTVKISEQGDVVCPLCGECLEAYDPQYVASKALAAGGVVL
ncbi:hypothetical protein [Oleidesulfovibrio sp.]|uniref:hypothetical protein n=1 Tax=Oleidesulfovibrio sp. TaxID=2909707 RepID=UPI003A83F0D8